MDIQSIHALLRERFDRLVGELRTPERGDAFIVVAAEGLADVCRFLRDHDATRFDFLRLISTVDRGAQLSSVYHLYSYQHSHSLVLRVDVDRETPRVPSVSSVWASAEWHEREAFDMMGIVYENHPELTRILLPDDWEGYPLRKDYQAPTEYHGLTNA
ncbi:MAG TPA: NADH-quinone oxidoreductase subunit C [Candidatus Hydrogenedentes bacterium]|nr:NADH-quinone oxidoreductase subunit C [Candidatus Hydrogenedentota bacterium]HOT51578.1 NADH-quinone oxidoreductase subunit C [Candidatus Hydrogenedentota bacterium]HOV72791.1 NADH-quinone oxidoreductase subunit C [Candidatus Hydrogenedentota bacterium]HPC17684.1 NADH-quinone oxidoreductase subunit C [Candidatus Hydrogenedentota bacterium]HRT21309.1 NADH-quinone oxidoreductase subunit C [Candidatus Hydrogenedentota bacterium]